MSSNRYGGVAVILHWGVAVLMVANVVLAWIFDRLPEGQIRFAIDTHKSIGITVLGLVLLRVLWRIGHPPPPWPQGALQRWERLLSHATHLLLYAVMLGLPLSGWLHDSAWRAAESHPMMLFGLFEWPRIAAIMNLEPGFKEHLHDVFGDAHEAFSVALYLLLALHVLGALKHQWLDGHPALRRMSLRRD